MNKTSKVVFTHAIVAYKRSGNITSTHANLCTARRLVVSFMHRALYLGERVPGVHLIGDWVGPRTGLVILDERRILISRWGSSPRLSNS